MSVNGGAEESPEISIPPVPPRRIKSPPARSTGDTIATGLFMVILFFLAIAASYLGMFVGMLSDGCLGNDCNGGFISAGFIVAVAWPWLVFVGAIVWLAKASQGWGATFGIPLVLAPVLFLGLAIGSGVAQLAYM